MRQDLKNKKLKKINKIINNILISNFIKTK